MKRFVTLIRREWRHFTSNQVAMLIFLGAPIAYALLIGLVYKNATLHDLPVIVVDLDDTPLSQKITDAIDDNQYVKVVKVQHHCNSLRHQMIIDGIVAAITIPDRFEADVNQKRHPEVNIEINGSNMVTANYASTGLQTTLATLNAGIEIEALKKSGAPAAIASERFESFGISMTRYFNPSSNYLVFLWPGMLGTIMQQVFLIVLALSFAKEYEDNTFRDLVRYARRPIYLLFYKAFPYFVMGLAIWFPMIKTFFYLFNVEMPIHEGAFYLISALFMLSVTFMGIAVSIIMKNQLKATEILMVIATPSFIISGQTWPLEAMPTAVQWLSKSIPLTHYLQAFRNMMMYNASLDELMPQIKMLSILTVVFFVIALVALRFKIERFKRLDMLIP
ncbi:MAG: ABC transporter permease [Breznakibacter sp.]